MERRVVITGMGAVTPLGLNLETTWENLMKAKSGIDYISLFLGNKYAQLAGIWTPGSV